MFLKTSLWIKLIGIGTTVALMQTIAVAKSTTIALNDRAISQFATIAQNGLTADDYIEAAKQKYGKGDYAGSLADYDRAIQISPKHATAYYNRGALKHIDFHDTQGALDDYNRAIKLAPKFASVYYNRASLKSEYLQDMQGALADYDRAIKLAPNLASAYYNRGLLKHESLNDRVGGIADVQQAVNLFSQQGNTKNHQVAIDRLKQWQQISGN
jgi:tetratricopeptide (TPR) repeat protein